MAAPVKPEKGLHQVKATLISVIVLMLAVMACDKALVPSSGSQAEQSAEMSALAQVDNATARVEYEPVKGNALYKIVQPDLDMVLATRIGPSEAPPPAWQSEFAGCFIIKIYDFGGE